MTNPYYAPGDQRAPGVQRLFTAVARRYDLLNDLQSFGAHRRWKRRVVELAGVRGGERALDLCCGTGDLAFGLAAAGARVTGVDFNEEMLRIAVERARRRGASAVSAGGDNPEFVRGDAQQLPFADGTFDAVTIGYGLRNLSSWERGLSEMVRTAKPGGRVVILEFGKPDSAFWRSIYFGYMKLFVPLLGLVFCRNPKAYSYILESLRHYPGQQTVASKMRECGLEEVRVLNYLFGAMSIQHGRKSAGAGKK
jgi:demethylmenaquinone methyltransferase/2-methoxy-6-polyprenyl-1,4-benzoquinol methylase